MQRRTFLKVFSAFVAAPSALLVFLRKQGGRLSRFTIDPGKPLPPNEEEVKAVTEKIKKAFWSTPKKNGTGFWGASYWLS